MSINRVRKKTIYILLFKYINYVQLLSTDKHEIKILVNSENGLYVMGWQALS